MGSSSMVGHVSDHSLSGQSHTYIFSSSEVRLSSTSFSFSFLLSPWSIRSRQFSQMSSSLITVSFFFCASLVSRQTLDEYPIPNNNNNHWQGQPTSEWNNQQVCLWLLSLDMERYTSEFTAKGVDGIQLLNMDGQKLKVRKNAKAHFLLLKLNLNVCNVKVYFFFLYIYTFSNKCSFVTAKLNIFY